MQVIHPQGMYNGLPPENVFIALDDLGIELGVGYVIYQYQPHLDPECPLNLYFTMDCPVCALRRAAGQGSSAAGRQSQRGRSGLYRRQSPG